MKRKTTSTAKVASTSGKAKTINVEVRKKHTFAKPDPEQIKAEALAKAQAEAAEKARAEQQARGVQKRAMRKQKRLKQVLQKRSKL